MASEKIIAQKSEEVSKLAEKMKASKVILLTEYKGITVADDTSLRAKLRETKAEYSVIKNNITRRALKEAGMEGLDDVLVGPTAVVLNEEDYLAPIKVIYKYVKENENYKIKGGIIEGKLVSVEEIMTLAKLPSREELLSKLAGSLLGTIAKLAVGLDQVRMQKENA